MSGSNTVQTTISYKLDARGLREARKELEKTFKPTSTKEMNASLKEMRGMLRALSSESARLTGELMKAAKGTQAFKDLEKQLKAVDGQMRRVQSSAAALGQSLKDAGHGSFSQGFLQGIAPGASGFLERGPGMKRQFAGQMIGNGIRSGVSRAVNAGSSMMGGQGPLTTMLGNIPFVGGAAGAAESAAGMAVSYAQARAQMAPHLGLGALSMRSRGIYSDVVVPGGGPGNSGMGDMPNIGSSGKARRAIQEAAKANAAGGSSLGLGDALGMLLNPLGIGGKGGVFDVAGKVNSDRRAEEVFEAGTGGRALTTTQRVRTGTARSLDTSPFASIEAIGRRAVMTRGESLEAYGELAGITGGRPSNRAFESVEAARAVLGVDRGASGSLLRQQRRAGTTGLGEDMLASTIGDALMQGLEGSEVGEYLQQIAQLQEQAHSRGVKIQTETISGMAALIARGMGLGGTRGAAVAGQMAGAASDIALGGARGPVDIQMLRAAGFDPKGGKSSYFGALKKLETVGPGGFDSEMLFNFVNQLTGGKGGEEAGFTLQRALGSRGINVGLGEGERIANAVSGGRAGFVERMGGLASVGADGKLAINGSGVTAATLGGSLDTETFRALTGTLRAQNAIQDKLLAAGQETVSTVQAMQGTAAELARKVGSIEPLMQGLVTGIGKIGGGIGKLIDKLNEYAANGAIPVREVP